SSLEIYPIPASTEITIKSAETINSIVIYNEAGAEVMNLDGDNEMVTTVNIESLATGYYFVKVNNQAPVKIIKK
ncbi:MAG: T9SS type A sorting domain-containing protein, partial [Muribaculaceae bacterium]|nr:T9SS type A sorting domain-containing protein [Muribaculaceae bacterium]